MDSPRGISRSRAQLAVAMAMAGRVRVELRRRVAEARFSRCPESAASARLYDNLTIALALVRALRRGAMLWRYTISAACMPERRH